jgi:hemoglobin
MEIGVGRPWGDAPTVYEAIGGDESVRRLADTFYDIVEEQAPLLQAMLPANTSISRQKLYEFLSGWMGGPHLYWERRGHPALRMRHAPFAIDDRAATEWVECMGAALERCQVPEPARSWLDKELSRVAWMLRNRPTDP